MCVCGSLIPCRRHWGVKWSIYNAAEVFVQLMLVFALCLFLCCVCVFVHPGVFITTVYVNSSFSRVRPHLGMCLRICECAVMTKPGSLWSLHLWKARKWIIPHWASVVGGGGRDPIRRKHSLFFSISLMHTTLMCFLTAPVPVVTPADHCHFQLTRSKQLYKSKPVFEMHSIPLLLNIEGVWERERETEGKSRGFEFCFCTLRPWNLNWLTFPSSCCCLNNLLWSKRHTVQRKQAVCSVLVWPPGGWEDETRETFVLLSVSHTNVFKHRFVCLSLSTFLSLRRCDVSFCCSFYLV